MSLYMNLLWILIGLAVLVVLWLIVTYNSLVRSKNRTDESWSDIDVQLKRRHDLIPNLMNTVKGYAKHESSVFEKVTQARTAAMQATSPAALGQAENMLTGALKSLFAVAEAYPELKASQNFLELQRDLTVTEDKIQAARRFYNTNFRHLNIKLESFPTNLIGSSLGFQKREFFEIADGERANVEVKF